MRAVFFSAACAVGVIHSLTGASAAVCGWNRGRFFFSPCAAVDIHSLTGASGGAFFFLLRARRGKFTPSLARLRLCVVEKAGAFFFFAPCAAGGNSLTHWRIRGRVFFFVLCAAGEIHSLTGASTAVCGFFLLFARRGKFTHSLARPGARFFFCCVRGGGHSLTHWRVRG